MTRLDPDIAARFMTMTAGHLTREYPNKLDHVMTGPEDVQSPSQLHPIFHGSFDWHSCVHGWWQVLRLARLYPALPEAARIRALADTMLTEEKAAGELAYLERPASASFERPYGWAWLMALHHELTLHDGQPWAARIEPMARLFANSFRAYLPRLTYPIRVGAHYNSSFALVLAHDWAVFHDEPLAASIAERAGHWFGDDRGCQAWEPGGDEFLSSALTEALLMSRVLPRPAFRDWFAGFLPHVAERRPATLFAPAFVSDRSDGKIAHLDGLNLSRAWCWRGIAKRLGSEHPLSGLMHATADEHLHSALPHLGDTYMGEHWLASFALLALEA
jgi:hypothetical protein